MLNPADRVVMVSGANRGIGRAIATALYNAGYTLSLGARKPESLDELVSDWQPQRYLKARYDAQDKDTHRIWVDETANQFSRIDGLVNNAGMVIRVKVDEDLENDKERELDQMWEVNVKAPLSMIRHALPWLKKSGSGRILNVASIAGKGVYNNNIGYSMTKFAVVALSHATRHMGWDDGVRCTALCPSLVRTDMTSDVETFPHEDMMEPEDIGALVATVMSLSNTASVAELIVNCRNDITM